MANVSDALRRKIEEALDDIESVEDFFVSDVTDTNDPDLIDITIRGRLKKDLGGKKQQDPASDYDRAMKGLSPWHDTNSHKVTSNN